MSGASPTQGATASMISKCSAPLGRSSRPTMRRAYLRQGGGGARLAPPRAAGGGEPASHASSLPQAGWAGQASGPPTISGVLPALLRLDGVHASHRRSPPRYGLPDAAGDVPALPGAVLS